MTESDGTKEIWAGDLFDREREAKLLIAYMESVASRPNSPEDARAFTLAVDAGYGEGKTYFLSRLARQLSLNHPVAFVDAWADDIADEPLTAVAATLQQALSPLLSQSSKVRTQWDVIVEKTGKIAKIAGKGALKRGIALIITGGATEAAEAVLNDLGEEDSKTIADAGDEIIDDAAQAISAESAKRAMKRRIVEFEEGQEAIKQLKASLSELISGLGSGPFRPPIFILIDELDRCRPPYALKLLEEIKHLFDVPGLVFVFGMHGEQLEHSVAGAYGPSFEGRSYLRRFFQRRYKLATPDLTPLIDHLIVQAGLNRTRLQFPPQKSTFQGEVISPARMIARYMQAHGLTARDSFAIIDMIQTCAALTGEAPLQMAYLLPLAISNFRGSAIGTVMDPVIPYDISYVFPVRRGERIYTADTIVTKFRDLSKLSEDELMRRVNTEQGSPISEILVRMTVNNKLKEVPLAHPHFYPQLLETVGRFENPEIEPGPRP